MLRVSAAVPQAIKAAEEHISAVSKERSYSHTKERSYREHVDVVRRSACVYHPQLVGEYDGTTCVKMYDWSRFFDSRTIQMSLKGISKMHHFCFTTEHPGYAFVKNSSDDTEKKIKLLKDLPWKLDKDVLPDEIIPPGLSLEHQWYLYQKIQLENIQLVCRKLHHIRT